MYYYLYQITNKVNGKIYVGVHKTKDLDDGYMGSGKILIASIKKHGIENFEKEILEYFETAAEMFEREKEVVNEEFLLREDTYNLKLGGSGGFDHINNSVDSRIIKNRKAREVTNRVLIERYGSICPPNSRIANSKRFKDLHKSGNFTYDNFKGKEHSEHTKEKIRKTRIDRGLNSKENNSSFGKPWFHNLELKQNRKFIPGTEEIGFVLGRKMKF